MVYGGVGLHLEVCPMGEVLTETKLPFGVELFKQTITNRVEVTEWTAEHIGYLDENKTQLQLIGTITREATEGLYVFNFRFGDAMKLEINNNEGTRVQLFDRYKRTLIADSAGDDYSTEETNYGKFLLGRLELENNEYLVRVSHDEKLVSKNTLLNYDIRFSSGSTYDVRYRTSAGAQSMLQHLEEGGVIGYSQASMAANMFLSNAAGEGLNIFDFYV